MIARGTVPVGHPVAKDGSVTIDLDNMVGIAGRKCYLVNEYQDGEPYPLVTDKECLIQLVDTAEGTIGGEKVRLFATNPNYVHISKGRIVHVEASHG